MRTVVFALILALSATAASAAVAQAPTVANATLAIRLTVAPKAPDVSQIQVACNRATCTTTDSAAAQSYYRLQATPCAASAACVPVVTVVY